MGRTGVPPAFFGKMVIMQAGCLIYPCFLQGLMISEYHELKKIIYYKRKK